MRLVIIFAALFALLSGCMSVPIHQGNRLNENETYLIKEGDSKFTIEQALGSPALHSVLHPNRVTYYEEFEDEASGEMRKRGVEVTYDNALRAKTIRRFGFEDSK